MRTQKSAPHNIKQDWKFVKELQSPLHTEIRLDRTQKGSGEASLGCGVSLDFRFPDDGRLATAYADFKQFLRAAGIDASGPYKITTEKVRTGSFESYKVEVAEGSCRILAGDTEGIRRALVFLEDEIMRSGGPFLKTGRYKRRPFIKTRISRCFFGPIKRPPLNRDELTDNVDYYPEEYLNRLAHESVNGLWLTIQFSDLCPSIFFPSHARERMRRFDKLNKTIEKCARYGIKIYAFCIEPRGFGENPETFLPINELKKNRCFAGHRAGSATCFCTSSKEGLDYLEECTRYLFYSAPGLGGLIDINLGERLTHCYSALPFFFSNNCPRCSQRKPWEIFADTTSALAKGMHKVNPSAELISWLYVPYIQGKNLEEVEKTKVAIREIAEHTPVNITLQYNFESGGKAVQMGKKRDVKDYWLAWPGPSKIFRDCAINAVRGGSSISAKIQVGCSHEVATVPFVPVPGNLYRKYREMHKLGVCSVMQCWYFGNYPGLMNKAAGELSFEPFPKREDAFLLKLARTFWGNNAEKAVNAWKCFQEGYSNFPLNLCFAWYGPIHNSVVWPLYLHPVDAPVSPSWKFTFPLESGDRIGECLCYDHTLKEALALLKRMTEKWNCGVKILTGIEPEYAGNPDRARDIVLAKALNIQIASAYNVFRFYTLRENLPYLNPMGRKKSVEIMKEIVLNEIDNSMSLRKLCLIDSRLGFHSEAEGYKYSPAKLKLRAEMLAKLLQREFPDLKRKVAARKILFSDYTGVRAQGKKYRAARDRKSSLWENLDDGRTHWRAWCDNKNVFFEIDCAISPAQDDNPVVLKIEPCRLWPAQTFSVFADGKTRHDNFKTVEDNRWSAKVTQSSGKWNVYIRIPFAIFEGYYVRKRPMRINIIHGSAAWIIMHPLEYRLVFGTDNPADMGWLFLK